MHPLLRSAFLGGSMQLEAPVRAPCWVPQVPSHRSTDGAKCTASWRAPGRGAEPAVSQVRCHSCFSLGDVGQPEQILILLFSHTAGSLSLNASATGVGRCW